MTLQQLMRLVVVVICGASTTCSLPDERGPHAYSTYRMVCLNFSGEPVWDVALDNKVDIAFDVYRNYVCVSGCQPKSELYEVMWMDAMNGDLVPPIDERRTGERALGVPIDRSSMTGTSEYDERYDVVLGNGWRSLGMRLCSRSNRSQLLFVDDHMTVRWSLRVPDHFAWAKPLGSDRLLSYISGDSSCALQCHRIGSNVPEWEVSWSEKKGSSPQGVLESMFEWEVLDELIVLESLGSVVTIDSRSGSVVRRYRYAEAAGLSPSAGDLTAVRLVKSEALTMAVVRRGGTLVGIDLAGEPSVLWSDSGYHPGIGGLAVGLDAIFACKRDPR